MLTFEDIQPKPTPQQQANVITLHKAAKAKYRNYLKLLKAQKEEEDMVPARYFTGLLMSGSYPYTSQNKPLPVIEPIPVCFSSEYTYPPRTVASLHVRQIGTAWGFLVEFHDLADVREVTEAEYEAIRVVYDSK